MDISLEFAPKVEMKIPRFRVSCKKRKSSLPSQPDIYDLLIFRLNTINNSGKIGHQEISKLISMIPRLEVSFANPGVEDLTLKRFLTFVLSEAHPFGLYALQTKFAFRRK